MPFADVLMHRLCLSFMLGMGMPRLVGNLAKLRC